MKADEISQVLHLPLAQQLLEGDIPARFAYSGRDGGPRVIPIAFHWDGENIVVCTTTNALKVRALEADPRVAITIDTNGYPPNVLLVRGTARCEVVDGIPDEYLAGSGKLVPDDAWEGWVAGVRALYDQMVRITIEPTFAKLLDFETTIPSNVQAIIDQRSRVDDSGDA
jgi:hypothetical protein